MRLSGLTLDDYFKQHIYPCVPGGMPDSSFYPLPNIVKHKTAVYKWDGEKIERWKGYGMDRPNTMEGYSKTFHSGGGGLFGTLRDYLEFVRALLQCDPRSPTKPAKPLLGPEAYAELYAPSIKSQKGIETMVASAKGSNVWNNPDPTPETCNHSVAGMLILGDWTGMRKKGSLSWGGAAHTHFWLDPASGIVVSHDVESQTGQAADRASFFRASAGRRSTATTRCRGMRCRRHLRPRCTPTCRFRSGSPAHELGLAELSASVLAK